MYDLNNTTKYTVWAVRATGPDVVYASGLSQWDADLVCNEMNSLDDTADYRVAAE